MPQQPEKRKSRLMADDFASADETEVARYRWSKFVRLFKIRKASGGSIEVVITESTTSTMRVAQRQRFATREEAHEFVRSRGAALKAEGWQEVAGRDPGIPFVRRDMAARRRSARTE
jgi:hypothetical protein